MTIIDFYFIFIITTACTCTICFFVPVLKQASLDGSVSTITKHPILSSLVYYVVALIFAPILFFILLSDSATERYKQSLINVVKDAENI